MIIIKIGGGAAINLQGIAQDLAQVNEPLVIVHGANALRDELAAKLGIEKRVLTSASGYASVFTDREMLEVMMMAYAGLRNKHLVELCQQNGINAVGLTGLDGRLIQGKRNRGIRVKENGKIKMKRDLSGKPRRVNKGLLELLLTNGFTPVITVPIVDENGFAVNSENDDIVALLQSVLHAEKVIQFIEAPGFLEKADDPDSLIPAMNFRELEQREAQAEGRMKRKILALRKLSDFGPVEVILADGRVEHPLENALNGEGTVIR